jgi:hypothetical protein
MNLEVNYDGQTQKMKMMLLKSVDGLRWCPPSEREIERNECSPSEWQLVYLRTRKNQ